MSKENRHEASGFGVAGGSHDREDIQKKSNTELLDEVIDIVETQSAEDMDVDAIMKRLALLQERAPVSMDHTPSELMADLKESHPLVFESLGDRAQGAGTAAETVVHPSPKRQPKRRSRFASISISVLAACFCLVVTANALGMNPVQAFLDWADGIVQIYRNPSGIMELPEDDPSQYHSLEEVLEAYDMEPDQIPNWIPQDYELSSVDVLDTGSLTQCSASFTSSRGELLIRATRFPDGDWSGRSENNNDGEEYVKYGSTYYVISNQDLSKAGWDFKDISYVISGNVTEQELKDMIDSIAEGAS